MSDPARQKRLLAVLLVVFALFAGYRAFELTGGPGAGVRGARGARAIERTLEQLEVPHLNLEQLRRETATYKPGRDPFRFGPAPPPPKPVQQARPVPRPQRPAPKPEPVRTVAQPATPRPPKVDFTYLGSFGPSDRRIAVFARGDEIYNAMAGDILLENFIVDKIGFESADITFVGFPDTPGTRLEAGG